MFKVIAEFCNEKEVVIEFETKGFYKCMLNFTMKRKDECFGALMVVSHEDINTKRKLEKLLNDLYQYLSEVDVSESH